MPFSFAHKATPELPASRKVTCSAAICEHPVDQNLMPVFAKLMAPLEFLLFGLNMLFLSYYYL